MRLSYRPVTSRVAAGGYGVFALWWALAQVAAGRPGELTVAAPVLVAIGALVYGVFWRPAVVVDDDAVVLHNVFRDVRVRWPALEGLDTKWALTLLVGDRKHRSWAAAAPGRPSPVPFTPGQKRPARDAEDKRPIVRASRDLAADSGATAFMVGQRWEQRRDVVTPGDADVTITWVRAWPAVSLAAAALAALAALVPL